MASSASISAKIARILASEVGLSTTTTSSGLLEEARTRPQVPSSSTIAHAVDGDQLADLLPGELAAVGGDLLEVLHHAIDDAVFHLVVAMRRHGGRLPGAGKLGLQLGQRLAWIAVEHVEHGECRHQAVVIAAAKRRVEEEMAGLLEADQSAGLVTVALDVGMAGLPEQRLGAVLA